MRLLSRLHSSHTAPRHKLNVHAQSPYFRLAARSFQTSSHRYGGSIAWTVRLPNKAEFRMMRWTNTFPGATTDSNFLACSPPIVDRSLSGVCWAETTHSPPYRFESVPAGVYDEDALYGEEAVQAGDGLTDEKTTVYAPSAWFLIPSEYGFIVTDFVTKNIVACQSYCDMKEVFLSANVKQHNWEYERMKGFFDEGRIVHVDAIIPKEGDKGIKVKRSDYVDFDDFLKGAFGEPEEGVYFHTTVALRIEPPQGWRITEYKIDFRKEREAAYQKVKNLGFVLSQREEACWAGWIRDQHFDEEDEDYEDDEDEVGGVPGNK